MAPATLTLERNQVQARTTDAPAESASARSIEDIVLDVIQSGFPLAHDPYAVLAEQLGFTRTQVADSVLALEHKVLVRRIGGSFSSRKLGYEPTLCAIAAPADQVDQVAAFVNRYVGVTHNYLRDNRYNLWFTLTTRSLEDRLRVLSEISEATGCTDILNMPATRTFKIAVDFGKHRKKKPAPRTATALAESADVQPVPFNFEDPVDIEIVRWGQGNIVMVGNEPRVAGHPSTDGELVQFPYAEGARIVNEALGRTMGSVDAVTEEHIIRRLAELKKCGVVRRFGAMVEHRKMGYAFNGMTVWCVPEERLDEVGAAFAAKPFVTHCYERRPDPRWPYNFYAMTHGKTAEELRGYVEELKLITGTEPMVPVSTKEYKKVSMTYFTE